MPSCAVVINTWDGYSDAWPAMEHGLRKYWPDCPWPIYWMTNHKDPPLGNPVKCDVTTWTFMMREALIKIKEKYILFLHEDYWLVERIDTARLKHYLKLMYAYLIHHIQLVPSWDVMRVRRPYKMDGSLSIVHRDSDYRTSNQASLWRKEDYLYVVKQLELMSYKSAWDFEVHGNNFSRHMSCMSIGPEVPTEDWPIKYVYRHLPDWNREPIVKGVWTEDAKRYCEREGIPWNHEVGGKVWQKSSM